MSVRQSGQKNVGMGGAWWLEWDTVGKTGGELFLGRLETGCLWQQWTVRLQNCGLVVNGNEEREDTPSKIVSMLQTGIIGKGGEGNVMEFDGDR